MGNQVAGYYKIQMKHSYSEHDDPGGWHYVAARMNLSPQELPNPDPSSPIKTPKGWVLLQGSPSSPAQAPLRVPNSLARKAPARTPFLGPNRSPTLRKPLTTTDRRPQHRQRPPWLTVRICLRKRFRGVGGAQSLEGACQEICTVWGASAYPGL